MIKSNFNRSVCVLATCSTLVLSACGGDKQPSTSQSLQQSVSNSEYSQSVEFFVSPKGQAGNVGSMDAPFSTLTAARDAIRALDDEQRQKDITVWLRDGTYTLGETLVLNRQDGGQGDSFVNYRAYGDEKPIISSGKSVTGWTKLEAELEGLPDVAKGKVWVADVTREEYGRFTALFTEDKRLPRAKSDRFDGVKPTFI